MNRLLYIIPLLLASVAHGQVAGDAYPLPRNTPVIVKTASTYLTNEQALGSLSTGILKVTTTSGDLSVAVAGTDYQAADSDLNSIAAVSTTAFGRGLLALADAAAARTYISANGYYHHQLAGGYFYTMADGGTTWLNNAANPGSAQGQAKWRPMMAGTLTRATFSVYLYGTVGSGEGATAVIWKNGVSTSTITSALLLNDATRGSVQTFTLASPVTVNGTTDYLECAVTYATMATNPTNATISAEFEFTLP